MQEKIVEFEFIEILFNGVLRKDRVCDFRKELIKNFKLKFETSLMF